MSDPRQTHSNGRVAHVSLEGKVEAGRFAEGETAYASAPVAAISATPGGPRERELLWGHRFRVLETRDGWAFGFAEHDGYTGYVDANLFGALRTPPTHWVTAVRTRGKISPDLKAGGRDVFLAFGSELIVTGTEGEWACALAGEGARARKMYVPACHIRPFSEAFDDPVAVAELFLGTPYFWGGNSAFGIDCSGLIQAAARACGIPCPGDSDQQERAFGGAPLDAPARRGDLFFWKRHVALAMDGERLIHANAHAMSVAIEPISETIARIDAAGGGPVTARGHLGT